MEYPEHTPRKILLGGGWVDGTKTAEIISPWTGQPVATVAQAGPQQALAAAQIARDGAPTLRAMTAARRAELLRAIAAKLTARCEQIARVICLEIGKPMWLSRAEVQRAVNVFRLAGEEALRLPGEIVYPDREPQGAGMVGRIQYFPIGPVLGITPFNFPLNLVAHKVAPALAAGCPIVIKPAPQGPTAALMLGEIAIECGLPETALQVLPGGADVAQALCACDSFAAVSFTGSSHVGWTVKKNAPPRQRVILEMGGNAAVIVDESADLDAAASAIASAGYLYAGQVCISTQRVFVHYAVHRKFLAKLTRAIQTQVSAGENSADENLTLGPLIDKNAADRVDNWIQGAIARGATVLVPGERRGERLITPWLLENVPADEPISCEEVFGPVVTVQLAAGFDEALALANASRFGLQTSVFTQSLANAERAYRELQCGSVLINVPTSFRIDAVLYGGVKDSGTGREGVAEALKSFSEPKLLVVKP